MVSIKYLILFLCVWILDIYQSDFLCHYKNNDMDLNAVTTKYWGKYETYSNNGLNSAYQIHLPVHLED